MLQNHEHRKLLDVQTNYDSKIDKLKSEVDNLKEVKVALETNQDKIISD